MKPKRVFVKLKNRNHQSFLQQLSLSLYYHFFKSDKEYARLRPRELATVRSYLDQLSNLANCTINDFANYFRINLRFWVRISDCRNGSESHLICEQNFEHPDTIDILLINLRPPVELNFEKTEFLDHLELGFVPNIEQFTGDFINKSIFELLGMELGQNSDKLYDQWTQTPHGSDGIIKFVHEKHFLKLFGIGFSVITSNKTNKGESSIRSNLVRHHRSKADKFITLKTRSNFHKRTFIDIKNDRFNLKKSDIIYECSNAGCDFVSLEKFRLTRHEAVCAPGQQIKYVQKDICAKGPREFLIDEGFISPDLNIQNAAYFDIESFAEINNLPVEGRTEVISTQRMVCISVTANFGAGPRTVCFARNSFDKDDYQRVLRELTIHLKKLQLELVLSLPGEVRDSIEKIEDILAQNKAAKESTGKSLLSVERQTRFVQGLKYLKSFEKLKILGFNSERYDLIILIPGLIELWGPDTVEVIRRGAGYMMLQTELFRFLDVKNYIAGGGLADFAKAWGAGDVKQIFPYQYFNSIEDAKNATEWPEYKCFENDLCYKNVKNYIDQLKAGFDIVKKRVNLTQFSKQMSCPEILEQSDDKITFPSHLKIPNDHRRFTVSPLDYCTNWELFEKMFDRIGNMYEFLQFYNRNDTEILCSAFDNYMSLFWDTFRVNPLEFFSLSHMSEHIMFSEFDTSVNRPYSFGNGELNALCRQYNVGGLCKIFHRFAIANPDPIEMLKYDKTVWSLKNGQIIRKIVDYDFSNLYGAAMRLSLPTGPGYLYSKEGNGFKWSGLKSGKGNKFSYEALEWIQYVQSTSPFTDNDGTIHRIYHALNGPEKEVRFKQCFGLKYSDGFAVSADGYVDISGQRYFLFYDGCRFHNCDLCDTSCVPSKHHDERRVLLEPYGIVMQIRGCQWKQLKKEVSYENTISHFFGRKSLISETEIFAAITNNKFFGLIQVDIDSPDHLIKKWRPLNYSPIFRHCVVEESMVSPHMLAKMKEKGVKFPLNKCLTLCFTAKELLITTTMAKFFIDQGMTLSNLKIAIEFEEAFPLKDFVNKATRERVEATRYKNPQKEDLYKRIVNASYGRTGMRQDNRQNITYKKHSRKLGSRTEIKRVPLRGEFDTDIYEVTSEKTQITDSIPGESQYTRS